MPFLARNAVSPPGRARLAASLLAAAGMSSACRSESPQAATLEDSSHWSEHDFVRLELPVRVPSSDASLDQVEIWLRLEPESTISTGDGDGQWRFPARTEIDRVEFAGGGAQRWVADVRGARIDENDRTWFRVFRPDEPGADGSLFGFEWLRDDADAHRTARAALLSGLERRPPATRLDPQRRRAFLQSVDHKNRCLRCHGLGEEAVDRADDAIVVRGTDVSGFYTPATVFADEVPLESYGTFDPNVEDPYISIRCPSGRVQRYRSPAGAARVRCSDGSVPLAHYRLKAALEASEPRAAEICATRRFLYEHLDARGKDRHAREMEVCQAAG